MITDIISLRYISQHLHKFQKLSDGSYISDILIERRDNTSIIATSSSFELKGLDALISAYSLTFDFNKINCYYLSLYFLKRFTITLGDGSKTVVQLEPSSIKNVTTSRGVQKGAMTTLNRGINSYLTKYNEIYNEWDRLKVDEYIARQTKYIDCEYIEIYPLDVVNFLKELYTNRIIRNQ